MQKNWLGLTLEETERHLIGRIGVSERMAPGIAAKIGNLDGRLRNEFAKFWSGSTFDDGIEIEGWSYRRLMDEYGYKPIGGWTALDWLCREPADAKDALERGFK